MNEEFDIAFLKSFVFKNDLYKFINFENNNIYLEEKLFFSPRREDPLWGENDGVFELGLWSVDCPNLKRVCKRLGWSYYFTDTSRKFPRATSNSELKFLNLICGTKDLSEFWELMNEDPNEEIIRMISVVENQATLRAIHDLLIIGMTQ